MLARLIGEDVSVEVQLAESAYSWAFGDGTSGTGVKVSHRFGYIANYTVTLTVKNSGGTANGTSKPISCFFSCQ